MQLPYRSIGIVGIVVLLVAVGSYVAISGSGCTAKPGHVEAVPVEDPPAAATIIAVNESDIPASSPVVTALRTAATTDDPHVHVAVTHKEACRVQTTLSDLPRYTPDGDTSSPETGYYLRFRGGVYHVQRLERVKL